MKSTGFGLLPKNAPSQSFCTPSIVTFQFSAIPAVMMQYFWENMDPDRLKVTVLILRAYALYEKSRWVLAGLCIITLLAAILGILSIAKAPPTSYTRYDLLVKGTCILPSSLDIVGRYMPSIITAMLLEVAVFVLTLCKSIQHMRSGSRLLDLLLRDGIFYFGAVMLAHFGVILSYYLPEDISRGNFATLANCLNSTLISRLILHLRDPSLLSNHSDDQDTQGILSTVVLTGGPDGKIGAPHEVSFGLNSDIESSEFKPDRYTYERELDPKPLSNTTSHV
ncbi:hypothetical protein DFP72DRAFT_369437 [Ephemerocybe angulata]|uniref:Uncharacterized protein n=1 Tax=Ephemerocybe angulata TaxID=980116 RepID=A0A8H6HW89_9AGAR|nr:hypothetical protein DFP72DRAFT_369437 [Tulosesus angulatus]